MESAGPYHLSIEKRWRTKSIAPTAIRRDRSGAKIIGLPNKSISMKLSFSLELKRNSTPITKALETMDIKTPKLIPVIITIQIIFSEEITLFFEEVNLAVDIISLTNIKASFKLLF